MSFEAEFPLSREDREIVMKHQKEWEANNPYIPDEQTVMQKRVSKPKIYKKAVKKKIRVSRGFINYSGRRLVSKTRRVAFKANTRLANTRLAKKLGLPHPKQQTAENLRVILKTHPLDVGFSKAYKSKSGFAFGWDPVKGKKTMYIAGTRSTGDWIHNYLDRFHPRVTASYNLHYAKKLADLAKKNDVEYVFGHSRGGATVANMKKIYNGPTYVAFDGALSLSKGSAGIPNIRQRTLFDKMIGGADNYNTSAKKFVLPLSVKRKRLVANPKWHKSWKTL